MLRDDINNALKEAMKGGDKRRVSTLRLVNSALKNADIEARGQGKGPAISRLSHDADWRDNARKLGREAWHWIASSLRSSQ